MSAPPVPQPARDAFERALARAAARQPVVIRVGPTTYAVPSKSEAGTWRTVTSRGGLWYCTCEAARWRATCTHRAAVQLALAGELPLWPLPTAPTPAPRPRPAADPDEVFLPCQRDEHARCVRSIRCIDGTAERLWCQCACHDADLPCAPIPRNEPE